MIDDMLRTNWAVTCKTVYEDGYVCDGGDVDPKKPVPTECPECGGTDIEVRQESFHHFKWGCDGASTFEEIQAALVRQQEEMQAYADGRWELEFSIADGHLRVSKPA